MATTKKTETKAAVVNEAVKPVPAVEKVTSAAPVKETEVKAEEAPKKEAAPKKEEAPKKETAVKKTASKKTAAPKKEAVKKAEVKANVHVQFLGKEVSADKLVAAAKKAYIAAGHKEAEIKTIDVYVKPEESVAYYVVNGEGSDEYRIFL